MKINDAQTGRLRNATDLDETRIRFNWGYHDAASDVLNGWKRHDGATKHTICDSHFDPAYAEGYRVGCEDAEQGLSTQSSEPAWLRERHRATLSPKYAPYKRPAALVYLPLA